MAKTAKKEQKKEVNKLVKFGVWTLIMAMALIVIAVVYKQALDAMETYYIVRQVSAGLIVGGFFVALWVGYKKVA